MTYPFAKLSYIIYITKAIGIKTDGFWFWLNFGLFRFDSCGTAGVIEVGIEAVLCDQLVVCALFYYVSVLHYQNEIGVAYGGEAVGNYERGSAFHQKSECGLDLLLGSGIDGGGRFVKDQHGGR